MELADVLRHEGPPRTEYFLELPSPFGKLRLDLYAPVEIVLTQTGMTPEATEAAEAIISEAMQLGKGGKMADAQNMLLEAVKQHPYSADLNGALCDIFDWQGNLSEAEYYIKQSVAIRPDYRGLMYLALNLGKQGRLEEAATIEDYLWRHRGQAAQEQALGAVKDYLITLGRMQQPDKMLEVTQQAIKQFGGETTLVYQSIFALVLDNQEAAARTQLQQVLPQLDANDPLYPRFMRLRDYLGISQS